MAAQIIGHIGSNWTQIAHYTRNLLSQHSTPNQLTAPKIAPLMLTLKESASVFGKQKLLFPHLIKIDRLNLTRI